MVQGMLFDLDNTLVDTEEIYWQAQRQVLIPHGIDLLETTYYEHWVRQGKGIREFLEEKGVSLDVNALRQEKYKLIYQLFEAHLKLLPYARETVQWLAQELSLGLVTSSSQGVVEKILAATQLAPYFSAVVTANDVTQEKPHPEPFLKGAQKLALPLEEVVVVEDSEKGVLAAKRAGMRCIVVPHPKTKDANDFSQADYILSHLGEISPALLAQL